VKQKLLARLDDGLVRPGDRFLSARAIAMQFGVSYQTADRLLNQLVELGRLERRAASGTFVAGMQTRYAGVQLVFDARARRAGSFGAAMVDRLTRSLRRTGVACRITYVQGPSRVAPDHYPIFWEADPGAAGAGLLLNDRPRSVQAAMNLDSITVDDRLGGALAAELIARRVPARSRIAVLAGPADDRRSSDRVQGFVSVLAAQVRHSPTWYCADALPAARTLSRTRPAGVFACNDRLAEAVIQACQELGEPLPVLFGFDDAPIAEVLHLSTIAIPWQQLAASVTAMVDRRLAGDRSPASHLTLTPKPILRLTS
jgi:hypothetical protein